MAIAEVWEVSVAMTTTRRRKPNSAHCQAQGRATLLVVATSAAGHQSLAPTLAFDRNRLGHDDVVQFDSEKSRKV